MARQKLVGLETPAAPVLYENDWLEQPAEQEPVNAVLFAYSTLYSWLTQEDQLAALSRALDWVTEEGLVICEQFSPTIIDLKVTTSLIEATEERIRISYSRINALDQTIWTRQRVEARSNNEYSWVETDVRYIHPSEMRVMAAAAVFRSCDLYGGWSEAPLTPASPSYVAVMTK